MPTSVFKLLSSHPNFLESVVTFSLIVRMSPFTWRKFCCFNNFFSSIRVTPVCYHRKGKKLETFLLFKKEKDVTFACSLKCFDSRYSMGSMWDTYFHGYSPPNMKYYKESSLFLFLWVMTSMTSHCTLYNSSFNFAALLPCETGELHGGPPIISLKNPFCWCSSKCNGSITTGYTYTIFSS